MTKTQLILKLGTLDYDELNTVVGDRCPWVLEYRDMDPAFGAAFRCEAAVHPLDRPHSFTQDVGGVHIHLTWMPSL